MLQSSPLTHIVALTLDLDDTLWPVAPAIARAEAAQDAYLRQHCPGTALAFPIESMRALRDRIAAEHPQWAHDFTTQRLLTLRHALASSGDSPEHAEAAFEAFYAGRHAVELYAEVPATLALLARHRPLAALTNGNADLARIGLDHHFRFSLGAREHGAAKPDPGIFHAACARLDAPPSRVLHVGDDPWMDVAGAAAAGLRTCWINRHGQPWPATLAAADLNIQSLDQLLPALGLTAPSHLHPLRISA